MSVASQDLIFAGTVLGVPQPQGSKTAYPFVKTFADGKPMYRKTAGGNLVPILGVRLTEGRDVEARKRFESWRTAIAVVTASQHRGTPYDGPLAKKYVFYLPRPAKPKFAVPATAPDLDKLERAVNDALTGIVFTNDSRIVADWGSGKVWADERGPRVEIALYRIRP